ncbi:MAG: SDR family oxidoreductase [Bdellovibrio sp.]|nr:SDR family oxidoreductase [Bdellovibrio sp.]
MYNYTLITGSSSGIGYELAKVFAEYGHHLILVARSESVLNELALELHREYKVEVKVIPADLSQEKEVYRIFDICRENEWHVESLVNNAGVGDNEGFANSDWRKQKQMMAVNMDALVHLTHMFLPDIMQISRGGVLNVASTAAFQAGPFMAVYYATKAFVLSFSEALNEELRGTGVHVTTLCPGPTASGFQKTAGLEHAKLFQMMRVPSSREVARYGYKSFRLGRSVAIHGWLNRLGVQLLRISPRALIVRLVRLLQAK